MLIRKAQPTASDVHVSRPLTTISVAYQQAAVKYVADKVFSVVPVQKRGDQFDVYSRADFLRDDAEERAPATESAGGGWNLTRQSYFAKKYSIHKDVDDETRANADPQTNVDADASRYVTQQLLTRKEALWVSTYFTTGVWGTDITISTKWTAGAGDPIGDMETGLDTVEGATGFRPNVIVMAPAVWSTLKNHGDVLDRIKHTQGPAVATTAIIAALLEVEDVLVPRAVRNTAIEGATEATAFYIADGVLLLYRNPNPGLMVPSAGYTFAWAGLLGAGAAGTRIKRFRKESIESWRVEGEAAYEHNVVAPELGYFLDDVLT